MGRAYMQFCGRCMHGVENGTEDGWGIMAPPNGGSSLGIVEFEKVDVSMSL